MHYYQLVSEWCLFFNHSIKIHGNEPKFIFYSDLLTTLSTSIVDSIIYKLYFYKY